MTKWGWVAVVAVAGCSSVDPSVDAARLATDAALVCPRACGDLELCCVERGEPACVAALFNDRNHCGGCGIRCAADEACGFDGCYRMSTVCEPCGPDEYCCDGHCVSNGGGTSTTDAEFFACGGCGVGCNFNTADHCGVLDGITQCMCGDEAACVGAERCMRSDFGSRCAT